MKFFSLISNERKRKIKERINNPCSVEQIKNYEENWETILRNDIMIPHLKKGVKNKTSSVLHGGKSMNLIMANDDPNSPYFRESLDWDIYAHQHPQRVANLLEKKLEKRIGCNIAETQKVPLPKVIRMTKGETVSSELWRVNTPHTSKDPDSIIDVMDLPKEVSVIRHHGKYGTLRHESIMDYFMKTKSGILHPMRSFKASGQKQILQAYLRDKYGKTMLVEDDPEDLLFSKREHTYKQILGYRKKLAFPKAYHLIDSGKDWEYRFSYELYDKYYHKGGKPKSKNSNNNHRNSNNNHTPKKVVKKVIPKSIVDGGKRFTLHTQTSSKSKALSSSTKLKKNGNHVRNKFVKNGNGSKTFMIYKRRK